MPFKSLLASGLAVFGLILAAGCQTSTALPPPKTSVTLTLSPMERQVLSTLHVQGELKIILPAPQAGSGYVWDIVTNNTAVLVQTSAIKPAAHPTEAAAYVVTFQSIKPGRSILRFAAVRPGQAEQEPDDLYQVAVGIKPD